MQQSYGRSFNLNNIYVLRRMNLSHLNSFENTKTNLCKEYYFEYENDSRNSLFYIRIFALFRSHKNKNRLKTCQRWINSQDVVKDKTRCPIGRVILKIMHLSGEREIGKTLQFASVQCNCLTYWVYFYNNSSTFSLHIIP